MLADISCMDAIYIVSGYTDMSILVKKLNWNRTASSALIAEVSWLGLEVSWFAASLNTHRQNLMLLNTTA